MGWLRSGDSAGSPDAASGAAAAFAAVATGGKMVPKVDARITYRALSPLKAHMVLGRRAPRMTHRDHSPGHC